MSAAAIWANAHEGRRRRVGKRREILVPRGGKSTWVALRDLTIEEAKALAPSSSVYVYVSRQQLVERGACEAGLALWAAIAGGRSRIRVRWSALSYLWLESVHHGFGYWLFANGLVPMPNLARANLDGARLDGANLARANLDGARLARANLDRARLDGANLDGARLDGANLDGARLARGQVAPAGYRAEPATWSECGTPGCCVTTGVVLVEAST